MAGLAALIGSPVSWAVAFFIVIMLLVFKGLLIPREQANKLSESHTKVEKNLEKNIELLRDDRDRSLEALRQERDTWKAAALEAQEVSASVRAQNVELINSLSVLDHLLTAVRSLTGVGIDRSDNDESRE